MKFNYDFTQKPFSAFIDWYQFTQLQALQHQLDHDGTIRIRMKYTVRTKGANTSRLKAALRSALNELEGRSILTTPEVAKIGELASYMKPIFLDSLRDVRLHPADHVLIEDKEGDLDITIEGGINIILYEQPILAIISELWSQLNFSSSQEMLDASERGLAVLGKELAKIQKATAAQPGRPFRLGEGGTRRRFSLDHHERALELGLQMCPKQIYGTSNVHLALKYDLKLFGTQAHLFGMLFQQLGGPLHDFPKRAMQAWANEYRGNLGYMLPDVLTTASWLKHVDLYFAKLFDGYRQDSGSPHGFVSQVHTHLKTLGIDPATKFLVFSNGLNIDEALALWDLYEGKPSRTSFLIGTFLTNNVPGHQYLSQVIKLAAVNGQPVAKISDEPEKACCYDPLFLEYLKKTHAIV